MKDAIRAIIRGVKKNHIFDSHYVIQQLLKNPSNVFYKFVRETGNADTKNAHSQLAKLIEKCGAIKLSKRYSDLEDVKSWSENIHEKSSECVAWIRE